MTAAPPTARTVHVVPHTHWDREWYDPYPAFRIRLVELLDELLPRLEADAGFLFHAPDNVKAEFPQLPAHEEFDDLLAAITAELS